MAKDTQDQQMELMLQEGGMKDDGMNRDPVSGNDVPPGSLASEVRDDIPAQLSEGEYVIPADVVQFFGLKFFEDLIGEAKRGLEDMNNRGRIGGQPVPDTQQASMPMQQAPEGFPFNLEELQTTEPMQANKGGLVRGFAPGGATGISGQVVTPTLDNSASESYFGSSVAGARLIRFVADGCKQKTVLAQADRVPIASGAFEGGYVDITSDAGLDLVSKCNEINLNNAEEQNVIDRIGQDEYTNWKNGQTRTGDDEPQEEQQPSTPSGDDDGGKKVDRKDFIQNYDIMQLQAYADDISDYYGDTGEEDSFFQRLIKGVTNPIVKLNHKHIVARSSEILMNGGYTDVTTGEFRQVNTDRDENGNYINPEAIALSNILRANPGGMKEGERYKIGGVIYEYKGGKHVIYDPKKKITPTITNKGAIRPSDASGDPSEEGGTGAGDYIDLSFNFQDYSNTGILTASLDPTQDFKSQYDNYVLDSQAGVTDLTTRAEMERGTQGKRSGGDEPTGDSGSYLADNFGRDRDDNDRDDDDNFPSTPSPSIAQDSAKSIMNTDGSVTQKVYEQQEDKAQEDLSKAYGGGEASKKFGSIYNEGGMPTKKTIVKKRTKRKTTTKKK